MNEILMITKRDGTKQEFNGSKIFDAIKKANNELEEDKRVSEGKLRVIAGNVIEKIIVSDAEIGVEDIQDLVEKELVASDEYELSRKYIRYRYDREKVRNQNKAIYDNIKRIINCEDVQNQNANLDEKSFGGRMGTANSEIMKQYALDNLVSEMAKNNHLNNEIYIHDLDMYAVGAHNCLSIPFDDLLAKGFNTRQTDVRPANSINTAFQLVAVIFQIQSLQQFGRFSAC